MRQHLLTMTFLSSLALASASAFAQTAPAPVTPQDTQKIEAALDQSYFVVIGKLTPPTTPDAKWNGMVAVSTNIISLDGGGPSGFPLWFTDADGFKMPQEGIWFVVKGTDKYTPAPALAFLPLTDKDKVLAVAEKWLTRQIETRLAALPALYKKDPDGDQPATWKAMAELTTLGTTEIYFPAYKTRTNDHPSKGHIASAFAALGIDFGVPPYLNTPADRDKAIATFKTCADGMIQNAVSHDPITDENLQFAMGVYMYQRLTAITSTLALADDRLKSEQESWSKDLAPGTKPTRMSAFKMKLAKLTKQAP